MQDNKTSSVYHFGKKVVDTTGKTFDDMYKLKDEVRGEVDKLMKEAIESKTSILEAWLETMLKFFPNTKFDDIELVIEDKSGVMGDDGNRIENTTVYSIRHKRMRG